MYIYVANNIHALTKELKSLTTFELTTKIRHHQTRVFVYRGLLESRALSSIYFSFVHSRRQAEQHFLRWTYCFCNE